MTLGTLYSGQLTIDSQMDILRQRSFGKNYQELEDKLNAIFYPKDKPFNFERVQNDILSKEAQLLEENIIKNANAILGEGRIEVNSKKTIDIKSIEYYVKRAEKVLNGLSNKITSNTKVLDELKELINNAKDKVKEYYRNPQVLNWNSDNFYGFYSILSTLKSISNLSGLDNYSTNRGIILEEIFGGGASGTRSEKFNDFIDKLSEDLVNAGIEGIRTGADVENRGEGSVYVAGFEVDKKSKKSKATQIATKIQLGKLGDISSNIIYDAGAARQIKMDVMIKFKTSTGNTQSFRASLKNWSSINHKSLGVTSILGAILRTSGEAFAKAYSLSMLAKPEGNLLNRAHKMARLNILIDIITGFSQKSGYADTLIINTGTAIKVIDPMALITEAYTKNIRGYNEDKIVGVAHKIMENMKSLKSPGRTAVYYGNLQAYLAAKKVSVLMNFNDIK